MYGAQTIDYVSGVITQFENDVEMYGAQTQQIISICYRVFENDVEMYGAQTGAFVYLAQDSLRMM